MERKVLKLLQLEVLPADENSDSPYRKSAAPQRNTSYPSANLSVESRALPVTAPTKPTLAFNDVKTSKLSELEDEEIALDEEFERPPPVKDLDAGSTNTGRSKGASSSQSSSGWKSAQTITGKTPHTSDNVDEFEY